MIIRDIGEFGLIEELRNMFGYSRNVVVGIGDDCAVLRSARKSRHDLFTVDTIVEDVHFRHEDPPSKIGRKAMAVNISDIASMGGVPEYAVVSLAVPGKYDVGKIRLIYAGMKKIAREYGINIVGGDTVNSPDRLVITIAMTGNVEKDKIALRSGARPGDLIFVTGTLGGSIYGRHLSFTPRLEEARYLVSSVTVTSMIDLSDGLASDLRKLLDESSVGAEIAADSVPISPTAKKRCGESGKTPLDMALTDGEDFELLFTVPEIESAGLVDKWRNRFNLRLTCIGKITGEKKFRILDKKGVPKEIDKTGYDHFG